MADPAEPENPAPSEEELRAQLDEQVRNLRIEDLILQSAVSILNLSARRIAKDDERDLDQAKAGIDAARELAERAPEEARGQLREAVAELQLLYAKHASGEAEPATEKPAEDAGEQPASGKKPESPGSSKLWTPGDG